MKKESLNALKSIYDKVARYRCCSIGSTQVEYIKDEIKNEDKEKIMKIKKRKTG